MVTTHRLKLLDPYYDDVLSGRNTFEVRRNDRVPAFSVGSLLLFDHFDPEKEWQSGKGFYATVEYVLPGGQFGIDADYVVLGIQVHPFHISGRDYGSSKWNPSFPPKTEDQNTTPTL